MKKATLFVLLALFILNTTAFGELTQSELAKLEQMFRDSEKRMQTYMDLKIDALDQKLTGQINALDQKLTGQIDALDQKLTGQIEAVKAEIKGVQGSISMVFGFVIALIALIAVAIGLPQFLLARRGKEMETYQKELQAYQQRVEALSQEIEKLKQQRIIGS